MRPEISKRVTTADGVELLLWEDNDITDRCGRVHGRAVRKEPSDEAGSTGADDSFPGDGWGEGRE